jgi:hypothetical protein
VIEAATAGTSAPSDFDFAAMLAKAIQLFWLDRAPVMGEWRFVNLSYPTYDANTKFTVTIKTDVDRLLWLCNA